MLRALAMVSRGSISACLSILPFGVLWIPAAHADDTPAEIVSRTDLTEPFHTKGKWELVVTQEPAPDEVSEGDLHICFVHDGKPSCATKRIPPCDAIDGKPLCPAKSGPESIPLNYNRFESVAIFDAKPVAETTLLVLKAGGNWGGPSFPFGPTVWRYSPERDAFTEIFSAVRSSNMNGEARFVTDGPLAGSVITSEPTFHRPYRYEITVYRLTPGGHYRQALRYEGKTLYADGNPLAVIDSQMPDTLRRLHLWTPGDPLPKPARIPDGCSTFELRKSVEWCR